MKRSAIFFQTAMKWSAYSFSWNIAISPLSYRPPRQGMQIDDEPDAFPVSERKHLFKVVEHAVEPGVVLSEIAVGAGLSPVADHLGADGIHVPLSERVEILRLESDRGHLARARIVNSTKLSALGARSNSASAQFIAFLFSGRMTTRRYCFPSRVSSVAPLQSFQSDLSGTAEAVSQNSRSGRKNFQIDFILSSPICCKLSSFVWRRSFRPQKKPFFGVFVIVQDAFDAALFDMFIHKEDVCGGAPAVPPLFCL